MEDKTQEKLQLQDEISLVDILRLFIRKIGILIIVAVLAIIAGASYGFIKTRDVNYFGTTIAFYVNPQKDENSDQESEYSIYGSYGENVMDNMVKLLSSELFAERLMLESNGLPSQKMVDKIRADVNKFKTDENTMEEAVAKANDTADTLLEKMEQAKVELENIKNAKDSLTKASSDLSQKRKNMSAKETEVKNAWVALGNTGTPSYIASPTKPEQQAYNALWMEYQETIIQYSNASEDQTAAKDALRLANQSKNEVFNDMLAYWREAYSTYYASELSSYRWAASYSYKSPSDGSDSNFARSFFYVYISVINNENFANTVRNRIINCVPAFIEEIMPVPGGYFATNCQRITYTDYIENTNAGYARNTAIKYAILLAAISVIVACVIIVIIDRSDKRLRAVEQITEKFNLPVLGVIPNIHIEKEKNTEDNE